MNLSNKINLKTSDFFSTTLLSEDKNGIYKKYTIEFFKQLFVLSDFCDASDQRRKVKNAFVIWMDNIIQLIKVPIKAVEDDLEIEEAFNAICRKQYQGMGL